MLTLKDLLVSSLDVWLSKITIVFVVYPLYNLNSDPQDLGRIFSHKVSVRPQTNIILQRQGWAFWVTLNSL